MNENASAVVFGESSAAVLVISQLVKKGQAVVWAVGSGAKLLPVMPYVKSESALGALLDSEKIISDDLSAHQFAEAAQKGLFHRVFKNKGFKPPKYSKVALADSVWAPEQAYLGTEEFRSTELTPASVEQQLRETFENHPLVKKVASAPIVEVEVFEHGGKIQFANGFITEFNQFYFCDSLSELKAIPKLATVLKHQMANVKIGSMMSALQVVFHHSVALKQEMTNGLVIPLNRDSGESFDRDVLGYFMEPKKSVWTVFLQPSEIEENHEIMKKLRKLKQGLNKAFDSPEFLPENCKEFMATVEKEQVRFEAGYLAMDGAFKESRANEDFILLTDAFGTSAALEKLALRFGIEPVEISFNATATDLVEATSDSFDEIEVPAHLIENPSDDLTHL
jgi:hypothetical protein